MQQMDHVWSWSETFLKSLEGLMREPQSHGTMRSDWLRHSLRLGLWRRQVDVARELYRDGHADALRVLHDYWRTIADDIRKQVGFARESYHELSPLSEHLRKKPAGVVEWQDARSHG
jgi:hypothetical protein